jgi:hypothetical protein
MKFSQNNIGIFTFRNHPAEAENQGFTKRKEEIMKQQIMERVPLGVFYF